MAALFGAALVGFLLGVLLMVLVVSGHREEDLAERVDRSEAERRRPDRRTETADPLEPAVDGRRAAGAQIFPEKPGRSGRVDE